MSNVKKQAPPCAEKSELNCAVPDSASNERPLDTPQKSTEINQAERMSKRQQMVQDLSYNWPMSEDTLNRIKRNFQKRLPTLAWVLGIPADLPDEEKMFRVLTYAILDPYHYIDSPVQQVISRNGKAEELAWEPDDEKFSDFLAGVRSTLIPWGAEKQEFLQVLVSKAMLIDWTMHSA